MDASHESACGMSDVRRERQLGNITSNLQQYEAPVVADWIEAIKRQVCPLCGAGPFSVVALHVAQMHGINRLELRDLLGLLKNDSICDPNVSAARSVMSREMYKVGRINFGPVRRGVPKHLSRLGKERARLGVVARFQAPGVQAKSRQTFTERTAAKYAERNSQIAQRALDGKAITEIAEAFDLSPLTVSRIVKKQGVLIPDRRRRA
jgi:transposase